MSIDLDAYLSHIHYSGPRAPTLDTLRGIISCHTSAIPFENLDPLLGRPVSLDIDSLMRKLVHAGRGGYCFEHNTLLLSALQALGYAPVRLSARVRWNQPADAQTPRSHALLLLELEGARYIADVGFGGMTLTGVLDVDNDAAQPTPHERFRLTRLEGGALQLEAELPQGFMPLYRFTLEPQAAVDYEVANYFTSTHPSSHFRHRLMLARTEPGRRFGLVGNVLTVHAAGQPSERRSLSAASDLRDALQQQFALRLPDDPEIEPLLARLAAAG